MREDIVNDAAHGIEDGREVRLGECVGLDPLWISAKEPFKGAKRADLGCRVIIQVAPQDVS